MAILETIQACDNSTYYNDFHPDMAKYWKEFAKDLVVNQEEDIDIDFYTGVLEEEIGHLLAEYCYFGWQEGEYMVLPCIENAQEELERYTDLPTIIDDDGEDTYIECNPDSVDHCLVINDHDNTTLYSWQEYHDKPSQWVEVWSVV
jgi:hypothetical protein